MPDTWAAVPFRNTYHREVVQRHLSWDTLAQVLTAFSIATEGKAKVPAWSPALYKEGTTRGKANVLALSCLVLDYDTGTTTIKEAIKTWDWRPGMLHTSWSHTEDRHRFRVILPLHQPVPATDWPGVFAWADRWTRRCTNEAEIQTPEDYAQRARWESTIDVMCKDPGRIYYLPALRDAQAPHYATQWPGEGRGEHLGAYTPWAREVRAHRAAEAARHRPPAGPIRIRKAAVRDRERQRRYRLDPGTRERLGVELGGRNTGEAIRGVPCPGCGRPDVWWLIRPDKKSTASCNHTGSCGWYGSLYELALMGGG